MRMQELFVLLVDNQTIGRSEKWEALAQFSNELADEMTEYGAKISYEKTYAAGYIAAMRDQDINATIAQKSNQR